MELAHYYGNESLMHSTEVKEAIIDGLGSIATIIQPASEVHLIGIGNEDCVILSRLVIKAL